MKNNSRMFPALVFHMNNISSVVPALVFIWTIFQAWFLH